MKLGGTTFIHNGVEYDYCFEQSIRSLAGVCDEVVVVEAGSTDETRDVLSDLCRENRHVRVIHTEWNPQTLDLPTKKDWTKDLANLAIRALKSDMNFYLQGDEVLHEEDFQKIRTRAEARTPIYIQRLNFWGGPRTIIPHGKVCGHMVARIAPSCIGCEFGSEGLKVRPRTSSSIRIFHYGFLRKGPAFRKKSEIMTGFFHSKIDPIIYEYEKHGPNVLYSVIPESECIPFQGSHPEIMKPWLKERGFNP